MGEHKRNPRVALAEKGELPERVKKKSKKEVDAEIQGLIAEVFLKRMMGVK